MSTTFHRTMFRRVFDELTKLGLRLGLVPRNVYLLTVPGRKSGRLYATPVTLVEEGGARWLVAPYGDVSWVKNARAAGWASLSKRNRSEIVGVRGLGPAEAAPVLKAYLARVPIVRPYFAATVDSPVGEFAAEADRHPVFRIVGPPGPDSLARRPSTETRT